MICGQWASAQSVVVDEEQGIIITIDIGLKDLQEIDRRLQDYDLLREVNKAKDERIGNLEKELTLSQRELELEKRENEINKRIIAVKDMEIQVHERAFNDMKEVTDRAIKLAETSKPKLSGPILTTIGMIIGAIIIGIAL